MYGDRDTHVKHVKERLKAGLTSEVSLQQKPFYWTFFFASAKNNNNNL